MKLWFIKSKGYSLRPENLICWGVFEEHNDNVVEVKGITGFVKKRYALEWLKEHASNLEDSKSFIDLKEIICLDFQKGRIK